MGPRRPLLRLLPTRQELLTKLRRLTEKPKLKEINATLPLLLSPRMLKAILMLLLLHQERPRLLSKRPLEKLLASSLLGTKLRPPLEKLKKQLLKQVTP